MGCSLTQVNAVQKQDRVSSGTHILMRTTRLPTSILFLHSCTEAFGPLEPLQLVMAYPSMSYLLQALSGAPERRDLVTAIPLDCSDRSSYRIGRLLITSVHLQSARLAG